MTAICEVIEEVTESFQGKRGKVDLRLLVCLDRTPAGKLRNTFDYVLSEDEYKKHNGKAAGQTVQRGRQPTWKRPLPAGCAATAASCNWGRPKGEHGKRRTLPPGEAALAVLGTLTFKSERPPERVRVGMFFALLRRTAKVLRAEFSS